MNFPKLPSGNARGYKPDMKKSLLICALLAAFPAAAQDIIKVQYDGNVPGFSGWIADKAIKMALARPDFATQTRYQPGVLSLVVSEKPDLGVGEKPDISFVIHFLRDNIRVGEAQEACPSRKLEVCADQIAEDVKGAAAVPAR